MANRNTRLQRGVGGGGRSFKGRSIAGPEVAQRMANAADDCNGNLKTLLSYAAKEVDDGASVVISQLKDNMLEKVDVMEAKLSRLEVSLLEIAEMDRVKAREAMLRAKRTADSEREEKALLCQWLNSFLCSSKSFAPPPPSSSSSSNLAQGGAPYSRGGSSSMSAACDNGSVAPIPVLTSMDFTFTRFALNMAMAAATTPAQVLLEAGVPAFLVSMLSSSNDLVTGPAIMALSQVSQHIECSRAVTLAGGVEPIVKLCNESQSAAVVKQAAACLACLGLVPENKQLVAARGGVRAAMGVISGYSREERCPIEAVGQALACLVNIVHDSDANRQLSVEVGVVAPLCHVLQVADDDFALEQACKVVANLAFANPYTANELLRRDVDKLLHEVVTSSCDLRKHSDIASAAFVALANLSNSEMNQAQMGAEGGLELSVSVCKHCESPRTVMRAAQAIGSLCFQSHANKTRCAQKGAVSLLLNIACRWGIGNADDANRELGYGQGRNGNNSSRGRRQCGRAAGEQIYGSSKLMRRGGQGEGKDDEVMEAEMEAQGAAAAAALSALAVLLLHPTNVLIMRDLGGGPQIVQIADHTEHTKALIAAAIVIIALLPDPAGLLRARRDEEVIPVEEAGGLEALLRCKDWSFGRSSNYAMPLWLEFGIELLSCSREALQKRIHSDESWQRPEFFQRNFFFDQLCTVIPPEVDAITSQNSGLGDMLFNIY